MVQPKIVEQLLALNHQFYQTFAVQFSQTRRRLQPGVQRLLAHFQLQPDLLDVGCGGGELARSLGRSGYTGQYVGLDFSAGLLAEAQRGLPAELHARFVHARLDGADWAMQLPERPFAAACCLAVLHHLPGQALRQHTLRGIAGLLRSGGTLALSNWQFLNSPRLVQRIQPWERAGLTADDVDAGDYLLDWRSGGDGLRYVHHFSEAELAELAASSGFSILESFWSDGDNGRLSLYQIWQSHLPSGAAAQPTNG